MRLLPPRTVWRFRLAGDTWCAMARRRTRGRDGAAAKDRRSARKRPDRKSGEARPAARRWRGIWGRLARWTLVAGIWAAVALAGAIGWYAWDLPELSRLETPTRRPAALLRTADGGGARALRPALWRRGALRRAAVLFRRGGERDRGPALLRASRDRCLGHPARGPRQYPRGPGAPGRQHADPAARQEPVSLARADNAAQDPGGDRGALAGGPVLQAPDLRDLRQPGLFRLRRLWRRRRREALFRRHRARPLAVRGGNAGRAAQGAVALFPGARRRRGAGAGDPGAAGDGRYRGADRGRGQGGRAHPAAPARRNRRRRALFRRLGAAARARPCRAGRARYRDPHHPRFPAATHRRAPRRRPAGQGGQARPGVAGRPGRDVGRRRDPRHGGRAGLFREPVQPRHPGVAPAGLGVQAVRLPRRAGGRARARRRVRRQAGQRRRLAPAQL